MDGIWMVYGWYMDGMWMVYGWYMDDIWMVYGWYMDGIWMVYGIIKWFPFVWATGLHLFDASSIVNRCKYSK